MKRLKSFGFTISNLALLSCLTSLWLFHFFHLSSATNTLIAGETLKDWQVLESTHKFFQLGFFYPLHSSNRYLAIRCMDGFENKIVWVANREKPLKDSSGYLNFTREGYLVISAEKGTFSITINSGEPALHPNTSLTIIDSGNLVLKAGQRVVWQSFDHPTDSFLPGMKIGLFGLNSQSRPRTQFLTSWVGLGAPSAGAFTLGIDPNNTKQLEVRQRGIPFWRSGDNPFWEHHRKTLKFSHTSNENESYFSYSLIHDNYSWIEINSTGEIRLFAGVKDYKSSSWVLTFAVNCGVREKYHFGGCIERRNASKCKSGDKFVLVVGSHQSWSGTENISWGLSDCEETCRNDCSCMAYTSFYPDGSGCLFSDGPINMNLSTEFTKSFYLREATKVGRDSQAAKGDPQKKQQRVIIISLTAGAVVSLVLLGLTCSLYYILWKKCLSKGKRKISQNQVGRDTQKFLVELGSSIAAMDDSNSHNLMMKGNMDHELPMFSFSAIEIATEHFSEANKLGHGGFGPVFKGKLMDGKEIAVKRLSERSAQGTEEFKNEVVLISKVQHKNLVRLHGCCITGEEKLLVYEYLPNKSLDTFLFDESKRVLLDWKLRTHIIEGIAQGLLYLHKYSRLKIIHRDLKTSNILLDYNMNPKISDFGMAKLFAENESRANTSRIVGTYGYMSPEYAMDGQFSVKSDVFSFGVMLLEIISGKRNTGFYKSDKSMNLTRHAWNLWKEERSLELIDPTLSATYCSTFEFERYVQIALLCVQENAVDRPNMSDVVSMIIGSDGVLPNPRQSNFSALYTDNQSVEPHSFGSSSVNRVTISTTYAR